MTQYRIKELRGVFTIEASYEHAYNKGTWWNKNMVTKTCWSKLDMYNRPVRPLRILLSRNQPPRPPILGSFKLLEKAQEHIDKHILKTKPLEVGIDAPIYHQVGNIPVIDKSKLD